MNMQPESSKLLLSSSDDHGSDKDGETEDGELIGGDDGEDGDDAWDDTLLIQSYEESTRLVEAKIQELMAKAGKKKSNRNRGKKRSSKSIENGNESNVHSDSKPDGSIENVDTCGANNQMETSPKQSKSDEMANSSTPCDQNLSQTLPQNVAQFFSPPPPNFLNPSDALGKDEQLSSMLMSWYMCGYHTGYYAALKEKNKNGQAGP
ncbi:survival motor neuron [Brevipalpus obovatus]|uniref:survival motor neuron n=1 Tax=Brevipalpus obovatus TaxID=246614 RepID=UPI003D9F6425